MNDPNADVPIVGSDCFRFYKQPKENVDMADATLMAIGQRVRMDHFLNNVYDDYHCGAGKGFVLQSEKTGRHIILHHVDDGVIGMSSYKEFRMLDNTRNFDTFSHTVLNTEDINYWIRIFKLWIYH